MVDKRVILILAIIVIEIVVLYCDFSQLQDFWDYYTKFAQIDSSYFRASYSSPSQFSPNQPPPCIIYFTTKTTPMNYEKRIHPLKISWFQKVHSPEMISLISDNVSDSSDSVKEKEFERQLVNEGYQLVLSNCTISHTKATLCCKTGLEFEQYYKYLEKHKNGKNLPQWFCHVDDDVYVNMKELKTLLSMYNSSEPFYIGRYLWDWRGYNIPPHNAKKLQRTYHTEIKRTKYWLAAGPTYCISLPLMMKLQPYLSGCDKYMKACMTLNHYDEFALGAFVGPILGYNLTHTTLFDYDRVDLQGQPFTEVKKLCTINYYTNKKINQVANKKIPLQMTQKFNFSNDPAGILTLHCLLYNETSWCHGNHSNSVKNI